MVSSCQCLAILMFPFTRKERCILLGTHNILLGGNPEMDQYPMKGGRGGEVAIL